MSFQSRRAAASAVAPTESPIEGDCSEDQLADGLKVFARCSTEFYSGALWNPNR